jgi:septal ring factor EnvC (AmiA/AmiB activator)
MSRPTKKKANYSLKPIVSSKETNGMNMASSGIGGMLDNLKGRLGRLEKEIKADEAGKSEFDNELAKLANRRAEVERRLHQNENWAKNFDADIGPFEAKYQNMTGDMGVLYNNAKVQHANGLEVLKSEFGYNPAFKKHGDTFSATPFRPK